MKRPVRSGLGVGAPGEERAGKSNSQWKRAKLDDDDDLDIDDDEEEEGIVKAPTEVLSFEAELAQQLYQPPTSHEDEEDDPLEAFMSGLQQKPPSAAPAPSAKPNTAAVIAPNRPFLGGLGKSANAKRRMGSLVEADEEEDHVANFMEARKRSGAAAPSSAPNATPYDSEGEGRGSEGEGDPSLDPGARKQIEPLPSLDHSAIEYEDFTRDFYDPDPSLAALTPDQVEARRAALGLSVVGSGEVPAPVETFDQCFRSDPLLMSLIRKAGYSAPTAIQAQVLPCVLSGRDVMALAKTGSGKTAAYVLPMVVHLMDQRELEAGEGPIALLVTPTRELSEQVHKECLRFGRPFGLTSVAAFGGLNKHEQFKQLKKGCEVAVCTPGRMIDLLRLKGGCTSRRVTYVVLDEADRMFDLGFEAQVRSLVDFCRPDRQTLLFSATMPPRIEALARDVLEDPVRVALGTVGAVNADVQQSFEVFASPEDRDTWLDNRLGEFVDQGDVIVFANAKARVEGLTARLASKLGVRCGALHGDMHQTERMDVLSRFRAGALHVLVATDVAARGLDIKTVRTVINYEAPRDVDTLVHRVGRTGRAGDKEGRAVTLLLASETRMAGKIATALVSGGVQVPKALSDLARRDPHYRKPGKGGQGKGRVGAGNKGRQAKVGGAGLGFGDSGGAGAAGVEAAAAAGLGGFSHAAGDYTAEMADLATGSRVTVVPAHHPTALPPGASSSGPPGAPPPPPPPPPPQDDPDEGDKGVAAHIASTFRSQVVSSATVGGSQPSAAAVVIMPRKNPAPPPPPSAQLPSAVTNSRFLQRLQTPQELAAEAIERARRIAAEAAARAGAPSTSVSGAPTPPYLVPPPAPHPVLASGLPPVPSMAAAPAALPRVPAVAAAGLPPVPPIAASAPPPHGAGGATSVEDAIARARAIAEGLLQQQQAQQGRGGGPGGGGREWGNQQGGRGGGGRGGRGGGGRYQQPPPANNWAWGKG